MEYQVLHTLNALRVCMEFCVIHYHLSFLLPEGDDFLSNHNLADNSMCFFFVLSGFCAAYSNLHTDFGEWGAKLAFIKRRLWKVYPAYLAWYLLDLPGAIVSQSKGCPLFWLALASQPVLLHPWLGIHHIGIANGVSWYLGALFWLWFLFPFLNVKRLFASYAWAKIVALYLLSLAGWLALYQFNIYYLRGVPLLRLCEFLMGCGAACALDRPLNAYAVWLLALAFPVYCAVTLELPWLWPSEGLDGDCVLWPLRRQPDVNPTIFLSKFALPFCLVIHSLATTELAGLRPAAFLHWDFFKSLSAFSLHAYLSHYTVACMLKSLSVAMGVLHWWSLDALLIACYLTAYLAGKAEARAMRWLGGTYAPAPQEQENAVMAT
jgi:peptidoglycan/LPS O-acetylase OafA/YrhL